MDFIDIFFQTTNVKILCAVKKKPPGQHRQRAQWSGALDQAGLSRWLAPATALPVTMNGMRAGELELSIS